MVIHKDTIRDAIAAYAAFRKTADSVISSVPPRGHGLKILRPEDQNAYLETPAYLRLVKLVAKLSFDERIDLQALGWLGRNNTMSSSWTYFLDHSYRMGIDDPHYEASLLGRYWEAGRHRLRGIQKTSPAADDAAGRKPL